MGEPASGVRGPSRVRSRWPVVVVVEDRLMALDPDAAEQAAERIAAPGGGQQIITRNTRRLQALALAQCRGLADRRGQSGEARSHQPALRDDIAQAMMPNRSDGKRQHAAKDAMDRAVAPNARPASLRG